MFANWIISTFLIRGSAADISESKAQFPRYLFPDNIMMLGMYKTDVRGNIPLAAY